MCMCMCVDFSWPICSQQASHTNCRVNDHGSISGLNGETLRRRGREIRGTEYDFCLGPRCLMRTPRKSSFRERTKPVLHAHVR